MGTTVAPAPATAPAVIPATPATATAPAVPVAPATPVAPIYVPSGDEAARALLGEKGSEPKAKTREEIRDALVAGPKPAAGPTDQVPAPTDIAAEPAEIPAAPPEGEAPPIPTAPGDGLTFRVKGPDGKYITPEAVAQQNIEFKVGDKHYVKTPAELVRMAASGIASSKMAGELGHLKTTLATVQHQAETRLREVTAEKDAALNAQMALNIELLESPAELVNQRREAWAAQNTPEKEAERLRRELATTRETAEQDKQRSYFDTQAAALRGRLEPLFMSFSTTYPEVSPETRWGKIAFDTQKITVNGVIHPAAYPAYEAYLRGPFTQWLVAESARVKGLSAPAQEALRKAEKAEADAQRDRQRAVQAEGRAMVPVGGASPDRPAVRVPQTREEAKQFIVQGGARI